jgi:serine/threonine protein phosphatase PrpC
MSQKRNHRSRTPPSGFVKFTPWLKASAAMKQGNVRESMEDELLVTRFNSAGRPYYVFLVLDGHGGKSVAQYIKRNFVAEMRKQLRVVGYKNIRKVIQQTFCALNDGVKGYTSGSTASLMLVTGNPRKIWMAHVGDSSVYGIKCGGKSIRTHLLTPNHSVKIASEKKRIDKSPHHEIDGNYVATPKGHLLAVTRAIGDNDFGSVVRAVPNVKQIKTKYDVYALASDGIWDVMSGKRMGQLVNRLQNQGVWKESAYLINEWRNKHYEQHDNTSLILVYVAK